MSQFLINQVSAFAEGLVSSMGLELVEVQFRREQHGWVLRLFIDAEGGITLDHCSKVSREVSAYLDVEDLIDHAYHLEVSSPGLERSLTNVKDFQRFSGSRVKVRLHRPLEDENEKVLVGTLVSVDEEKIELEQEGGRRVVIPYDLVSKARLVL